MKNAIRGILNTVLCELFTGHRKRGADPAPTSTSPFTEAYSPATIITPPTAYAGIRERGRDYYAATPAGIPAEAPPTCSTVAACTRRWPNYLRRWPHLRRRRSSRRCGRQRRRQLDHRSSSGWSGHPGRGAGGRGLCGPSDSDAADGNRRVRRVGGGRQHRLQRMRVVGRRHRRRNGRRADHARGLRHDLQLRHVHPCSDTRPPLPA